MFSWFIASLLAQQPPTALATFNDGQLTVGKTLYMAQATQVNGYTPFIFTVDGSGYTDMNGKPLTVGQQVLVIGVALAQPDGSVNTCIISIPLS